MASGDEEDDEERLLREDVAEASPRSAAEVDVEEAMPKKKKKLVLWRGSARRLVLLDPILFAKKTALVFAASYLLIPLIAEKAAMPAWIYASLLVLIHVGVLIIYLYRVKLRSLDMDRISLGARVLGLGFTTWLLFAVSGWQDREDLVKLSWQMLALCAVHTVLLALLMVAVEPAGQDR